ncbi:hypothetical protein [Micromonospora sp. 4G55]|uniref:hypothetical protein n=1 Tax=Micromonospora sp. 4G55 TaxID=2806102 RepID=UPI001EE3AAAE|nr:hypothetical protein [Micromonospora sp. 4G55]
MVAGARRPARPGRRRADHGADRAGKRVATFAVDADVRFASATDRAAFAEELAAAVAGLVSRYHDEQAPGGRRHRVVLALHPSVDLPTGAAEDS